jgi:predicted nucleic acid-binding protein
VPQTVALLDACVLIPAALRDTLLRAGHAGLYQPRWSEQILAEVQRNLGELTDPQRAQRLVATLRAAFPEAAVTGFEPLIPRMTNAPKDRHVLAAAVASGAGAIVTANLRDFPPPALQPHGIAGRSPDVFLGALVERAPALMAQLVAEQSAATRYPPLSVEEVLTNLARQGAADFAGHIRAYLAGQKSAGG